MNANVAKIHNNVEAVENNFAVTVGLMQNLQEDMTEGVAHRTAESYQADLRLPLLNMIARLTADLRDADALFGVAHELGIAGPLGAGLVSA